MLTPQQIETLRGCFYDRKVISTDPNYTDHIAAVIEFMEFYGFKVPTFSDQIHAGNVADQPEFHGEGVKTESDRKRVKGGIRKVYNFVKMGDWHTLEEISKATGVPEPSVSAHLRCFRREKYGRQQVDRKHVGGGLHMYRLIQNPITIRDMEEMIGVKVKIQPEFVSADELPF